MPKFAIITGASSGIGAALARQLATRGWSLALLARRGDLLDELRDALPAASVAIPCDVSDADAVARAVARAHEELAGPFDLAIANAGVGSNGHATKFDLAAAERMIRVNVIGTMNLFAAVIPSMIERRCGRFAGVASLAGLRGLPTAAAYSASKAAMQAFLEASRVELAPYGVGVTIVNPGFVATAMTEKNPTMPFLMSADAAAKRIVEGLERGKRVIQFPLPTSLVTQFVRHLPDPVFDLVLKSTARRKSERAKVKP